MALSTCYECRGQLSDSAISCPHCGAPNNEKSGRLQMSEGLRSTLQAQKDFSLLLGANRGPIESERVILHELGSSIKGFGFNIDTGQVTLTNLRIVLCCNEIKTLTKLMVIPGITVARDSGLPHITDQILLDDIEYIEMKRHGFTKKFVTKLRTGKIFTFMVSTPNAWLKALSDLGVVVQN